jgi:predicted  nucleic acid-binding Zn-ribbon protein
MSQNVLQATSDADQPADDGAHTAPRQDARALLGHLHSTLAVKAGAGTPSTDSLPPVIEQTVCEVPSFGRAVARQADQIQHLIEQINRLDSDTQLAELRGVVRDLYGALNDVVLRMKQNASEVAAKIGLLTGAVTIISGAPDIDAPHDLAAILDGAIAAAERMLSLERLQKEAGAAIVALEESASRGQHAVRDLSAGLAKLNAHAESDRNEIASLHQRIKSTDQSLAQGLARVDSTIESDRDEIASLHQRIESTDQSLAQELARVDKSIETGRDEVARLHQRIGSTDRASTQGLTTLGERATALRDEMGRMHERLGFVESNTALHAGFREKIEVLSRRLEDAEHRTAAEINSWRLKDSERCAALMNRLEALEQKNQVLSQDTEQMAARLQAAEQTVATMTQSQKALSIWQDRLAQVLAGPQLPAT